MGLDKKSRLSIMGIPDFYRLLQGCSDQRVTSGSLSRAEVIYTKKNEKE